MVKCIIEWINRWIDRSYIRLGLLLVAGVIGGFVGNYWLNVETFCDWGFDKTVAEYLATATIGIPIFIFLWFFRTRDIRQQINKTQESISKAQEQIQQGKYADAVNNIVSTERLKIEIGVRELITLSKKTPRFDDEILSVFLERLKNFDLEPNINASMPLTYGAEILIWLNKHKENYRISYGYYKFDIDFSYQTFYNRDKDKIFNVHLRIFLNIISFHYANLQDVDLQNINLRNADLTRANLQFADLRGVDLTYANLTEVNLLYAKVDENTKGVRGIWKIEDGQICIDNNLDCHTSEDWNNVGFHELIEPLDGLDNALYRFDNAIAKDENFARAYYNRGYVYFLLGDINESDKDYNEAQKLDKENPDFMPYPKFKKLLPRHYPIFFAAKAGTEER